jgi:hypothetical protein
VNSGFCVLRRPSVFLLTSLLASAPLFAAWEAKPGTIKVFAKKRPVSPSKPQRPFPPGLLRMLQAELVEDHEAFVMLQMPLPNASSAPRILRRDVADVIQILDEFDILQFSSFPVDARLREPLYPAGWRKEAYLPPPARDAFVLQFASPPRQSWIDELHAARATILDSMPYHGYVVLGDHEALRQIVERLPVQLFRIHQPVHKVSAAVREASDPFLDVVVSVANVPEAEDAIAFLASSTLEQILPPEPSGDRTRHRVTIATSAIPQLATLPAVLWIDLPAQAVPSGQREANLTIGDTLITTSPVLKPVLADHRAWIASRNLGNYTQQVKMAILDTGFDTASGDGVPSSPHSDFRKSDGSGTFVTVKKYTTETGASSNADCSGHGTFVAGVLAGNAGAQFSTQTRDCPSPCSDASYLMGVGVVPEVPLVVGRVFNYLASNPTPRGFVHQGFTTILSDLASQGVAIASNSWNDPNITTYTAETEDLDKLVRSANGANGGPPMAIYFSAGNSDDASNGNQYVSWPAIAKNVITVGASENFNQNSYTDYPPSNGYTNADDGNQIWIYSQKGPTRPPGVDNRIKPDLVAPGSGMESPATRNSAFGTTSCTSPVGTVGPVGAVIDSTPGQGHLWSRGTSFAAPAAAGAGALLYTWFKNKNVTPKPSLLKAMQITLARSLAGTGLPPDDRQGWGKADLTGLTPSLQPSDPYEWNNEEPNTVLTPFLTAALPALGSGYRILDTSQPVRITIVWTDAPGSPGADRELVNDLDLKVVIHGNAGHFALGNNFNPGTGRSLIFTTGVSGGIPDTRNNVEQVAFLAAEAGNSTQFHVEVFGRDIREDGIGVWTPGSLKQDFALFIQNAVAYTNNAAVTAENVPTMTVPAGGSFQASFTLQNIGNSVWSAAGGYKLGSIAIGNPFGSELTLAPGETIANPGTKFFTLNATVPYAAGTYPFQWRMFETPVQFGAATAFRTITVTPTGRSFYTVTPCRVFDTRDAGMGGRLLQGVERVFTIRGTCNIPPTATAVAANLTIVSPSAQGHLLAYPANIGPPLISTINFRAGQTRANNAALTLDTQGRIAVMPAGDTDLIFDVSGYFQ